MKEILNKLFGKDIYRFWSRKKLKAEIFLLKKTYNELFDAYKELQKHYREFSKENKKLKAEEQKLYDCILKWYQPTNEKTFNKLIEETKYVFDSFMQNIF